jgi:nicotinate-nucleotide adenylyltransferase
MATAISEIKGRRIGLLGGTFDPVHNGHLAAARAVKDQLSLDAVLLLPAATPPHKSNYPISLFSHRVAMLDLAVQAEADIFVCQIEQERSGPSYTIDTLIDLNKKCLKPQSNKIPSPCSLSGVEALSNTQLRPLSGVEAPNLAGASFYFIIGIDAFAEIYTWKDYKELPTQANLVVMNRPGCAVSNSEVMAAHFPDFTYAYDRGRTAEPSSKCWQAKGIKGKIYFLKIPPLDISSSNLRQKIASGSDIIPYVPSLISDYIKKFSLYGTK